MDRIGRFTVILATVTLPWFEPWPAAPSRQPLCRRRRPSSSKRARRRSDGAGHRAFAGGERPTAPSCLRRGPGRSGGRRRQPIERPPSGRAAAITGRRSRREPCRPEPAAAVAAIVGAHGSPGGAAGPDGRATETRAARADRLRLSDQPRHRLAALRRPAADRGRCPGQCLGRRSTTHAGQGPLGPDIDVRRRLYPARRRWPGFQQGRLDRPERELFLRRWRLECVQFRSHFSS